LKTLIIRLNYTKFSSNYLVYTNRFACTSVSWEAKENPRHHGDRHHPQCSRIADLFHEHTSLDKSVCYSSSQPSASLNGYIADNGL